MIQLDEYYPIKLCDDGVAFEVKPKRRLSLDLPALKEKIVEATGMTARVCLPVLLLLQGTNGQAINIYPEGRLLLRKFPSKSDAEEILKLLSSLFF